MDILVIGGGGREHAIINRLATSPRCGRLYCLPGNGGICRTAECADIAAIDIEAISAFATDNLVDFVVVSQDDPLALGLVDRLHELGIGCFGPSKAAARIESSKSFAKQLMRDNNIPTADYQVFDDADAALAYIETAPLPLVIKADGLALGKGVTIAASRDEARAAITAAMVDMAFGASGQRVVIEEFLIGPEVSVLAFTDGHCIKPLVASMDHKRVGEGDIGPNTGGMGAIAPNPFYTAEIAARAEEEIFLPTIRAMRELGAPFKGCLYFGLILTANGPKVIEYNCRFGDPETQAVLPLLEGDLLEIMLAVEKERLVNIEVASSNQASCCVVVASAGYPAAYQKGLPISGIEQATALGAQVFHAGTKLIDGQLLTNGGRVLGLTCLAPSLSEAIAQAYLAADAISFPGCFSRRDIGATALAQIESLKEK